jgi:hypothetical protein
MLSATQSSLAAMQRLYGAAQNQLFELQASREEVAAGRQVRALAGRVRACVRACKAGGWMGCGLAADVGAACCGAAASAAQRRTSA